MRCLMRGEEVVGSAVCWAVLLLMLVAYLVVVADYSCCSDYWLGILLRFHKGNLLCLYLYVSTYVYSRVGVCLFRLLFLCFCLLYLIRSLSFSVRSSQCVCNISAFLWLFLCPGARASERASQRGAASVDWECGPGTECDSRQDRLRGAS